MSSRPRSDVIGVSVLLTSVVGTFPGWKGQGGVRAANVNITAVAPPPRAGVPSILTLVCSTSLRSGLNPKPTLHPRRWGGLIPRHGWESSHSLLHSITEVVKVKGASEDAHKNEKAAEGCRDSLKTDLAVPALLGWSLNWSRFRHVLGSQSVRLTYFCQ